MTINTSPAKLLKTKTEAEGQLCGSRKLIWNSTHTSDSVEPVNFL
jgi:hypothetical protein